VSQSTMDFEAASRDAGIAQVLENQEQGWRDEARDIVRGMSGDFTGEDIRLACESVGATPKHHNAWGGFIMSLVRGHVIEPTGEYRAMRAKGSHARKTQVYRHVAVSEIVAVHNELSREAVTA
jgi:hypothetical protein